MLFAMLFISSGNWNDKYKQANSYKFINMLTTSRSTKRKRKQEKKWANKAEG